jgi:hypothetical protein
MDLPTRPAVFGVARSGPHGKKQVFPTCSFADEKRKWPMLGVGCKTAKFGKHFNLKKSRRLKPVGRRNV